MKDDKIIQLINTCVREASLHSSPSTETLKMIEENKNCLDVIIERLDNLIDNQKTNHDENKSEHQEIIARQNHTNGNVTALQKWKAYLLGAFAVAYILFPVLGYYYMQSNRYEMMEDLRMEIDKAITANNELQFLEFNTK